MNYDNTASFAPAATIPLRHRLVVSLMVFAAVLVILPSIILNAVAIPLLWSSFQQQVFNELTAINSLKHEHLEYWLENDVQVELGDIIEPQRGIFQNWLVRGDYTTYTNINRALQNALKNQDIYTILFIYDDTGRVLAASDESYMGRIVNRQPYFAPSFEENTLSPPYYEVGSGELVMFFTRPILDKWVVAGKVDLTTLQTIMANRAGLGETGETYLVSLDNNYLLTPLQDDTLPLNRAYRNTGIEQGLRQRTGAAAYVSYDADPVFGAYTWIPELNAALIAEIHEAEATSIFAEVRLGLVVLSGVLIAASLLIAFLAAQYITRPVASLTRAAHQVANGNLDVQTHLHGKNEIALLGKNFNTMTAKLRESIQEISKNEMRLRSLIDALPIGMMTYHVEPDGQVKLGEVNPAAKTLLPAPLKSGAAVDLAHCDTIGIDTMRRYESVAVEGNSWHTSRVNYDNGDVKNAFELYAFQTAPQQMAVAFLDTTERLRSQLEREHLQQQIIEAQKQAIAELSTPIIPLLNGIIIMPLIGSIDTARAQDIMRALLRGISDYRAKITIMDITGVPVVDSGVANHLNKTIQAARLKGAHTIITGVSDAVAETIVDLGIDWSNLETLRDLQTGLMSAIDRLGMSLSEPD